MNIEENLPFSTPIYIVNTDLDNDFLKKEIYEFKEKYPEQNSVSNMGGWQSKGFVEKDLIEFNGLSQLINYINSAVYAIWDKWELTGIPKLSSIWININGYKDFNITHSHFGPSIISGCYYVDVNENSGDIVFERPGFPASINGSFLAKRDNEYVAHGASYSPIPGKLILFPSYLEHYVKPNLSDKPRISIAFNYD